MAKPHLERITKLDAARRQLRTAVRMFFEDRDTVSIYTLAAAVEGILAGLLKQRGEPHFFRDSDIIRPEAKAEVQRFLNRPQNFFKHADKDPDEILEFKPEILEALLFECAVLYEGVTGRQLREGWVFFLWFTMHRPNIVKPSALKDGLAQAKTHLPTGDRGKAAFLILLNRADLWHNTD